HSMEVTAPVVIEGARSGEPSTEVATPAVPRRIDPYTDRTSRLPEVPAPREHTGSWPPADAEVARSMDRASPSSEPWEELFEPDELPPPRTRPAEAPPMTEVTQLLEEPSESTAAAAPKRGRFDRLVPGSPPSPEPGEPASAQRTPPARESKRSEPPSSFLGQLPEPAPSDPESTGGIRRAKRPTRD
ncbi:MAG: hypothetical protein KUG77_11110, partial [Nannocystaceae bacterium]|nr:hypothetical protein [Nannocystaceae bacterium]